MTLSGENQEKKNMEKARPSASLSTLNPTESGLGPKLIHGTARYRNNGRNMWLSYTNIMSSGTEM
jgi:hypothetical protein